VAPFGSQPGYDRLVTIARGSCLCGEVRYETSGPPIRVNHCHCSRCRKARGTAYATNLVLQLDAFRYLAGEDRVTVFKVPGAQHFAHAFCRVCGASTPRVDESRGIAIVPMGSFDDDPGARPERHIYVDSRAAWEAEVQDGLPTFPGAPPLL
jgi:hypothetical protein